MGGIDDATTLGGFESRGHAQNMQHLRPAAASTRAAAARADSKDLRRLLLRTRNRKELRLAF